MNKDKYVFAQLIEFLDNNKFRHLVDKYDGNRYVKHFTCWNQLLAMMFGQLSNRESLRDLIVAFEAHRAKQYHLGLGRKPIAKTTFASANQNRDYRIFEDFAFYMMEQARKKRVTDIFKLKGNVYAFDSTTIPLCLSVFWWAKFRKKKGGIKAHVLYDLESQVPAFFHISTASVYDSKAMKEIPYGLGKIRLQFLQNIGAIGHFIGIKEVFHVEVVICDSAVQVLSVGIRTARHKEDIAFHGILKTGFLYDMQEIRFLGHIDSTRIYQAGVQTFKFLGR